MSDASEDRRVQASVVVTAANGLHARPAIKLSKLAKTFSSRILLQARENGDWIDVKSVARLMALKVEEGRKLTFAAYGEDAERAVAALRDLVVRNFDEAADDA